MVSLVVADAAPDVLLVALATPSGQLKVVRVAIQWGTPDKQVPPGSMHLSPSLTEKNVAVTSWFQHGASDSTLDASMAQLSHVEMLPSLHESSNMEAPPVVLAVRSHVPQDGSLYNQELQSIIDRWEVISDQPQSHHAAFEQLSSKNGTAAHFPVSHRS